MPTYHVRAAITSLLFLTGFCLLILLVGAVPPVNTTLSGFVEGCEDEVRLCWYGIIAGETLLDNAQQILVQAGYRLVNDSLFDEGMFFAGQYHATFKRLPQAGCNRVSLVYPRHVANPQVMISSLDDCQDLYVADLLEAWGSPHTVDFNQHGGQLVFSGGTRALFGGDLELYTPIDYLWINHYGGGSGSAVFAWQGIYPAWWYCYPAVVDECVPL